MGEKTCVYWFERKKPLWGESLDPLACKPEHDS